MDHQSYIPGTKPADPGPLSRFTPPLEENTTSRWLSLHIPAGSWLLDPFGFSPRLTLEAEQAKWPDWREYTEQLVRFATRPAATLKIRQRPAA